MKLFDLHCDTITELCKAKEDIVNKERHISLDRAPYEGYVQTYAIFMPDDLRGQAAIDYFDKNLRYFKEQMEKYHDRIEQAYTGADVDKIIAKGKAVAVLSIEGGSALAGDLSRVAYFKEQGVFFITLTWSGANELGSGIFNNDIGLTPFGKAAVAEMERYGIVADISHLSDAGLDDLMAIATKPYIATHSNARVVTPMPRNLRDDQFEEIVRRKGLCGINFFVKFLRETDYDRADFADVVRHVEHFLALGGEDVLALGSDFDGARISEPLNSVGKLGNLYNYMVEALKDRKLVDKIFFENANRFCKEHF